MIRIEKEANGFKKGNLNDISSMHNIRFDPDLGVGKAAVEMITCT